MTGQAAENMADIMDELSGQIAYWASQGTQRANLTVGGNRDNPLEVSIAMRDGEVHVAFEAAQDDIREALTTNAEAILRNMLESRGMTLGDVTVGQRPPSPDQGAATPQERNGQNPEAAARLAPTVSAGATRTGSGHTSAPMLRRPDIATAQKVDLFA
jgi:flagellar hook-length control protein FliK